MQVVQGAREVAVGRRNGRRFGGWRAWCGSAGTLLARIAALRTSERFVVCDLPGGSEGYADLRALSQGRRPGQLLIVVQRTADRPGHELLWAAIGGLPGPGAKAGADALIEISTRYGLRRAEQLILGWLDRRGLTD